MKTTSKYGSRRVLSAMMAVFTVVSLFSSMAAMAAQPTAYRDPAEHWINAENRTDELDVNAVTTHETFTCFNCGEPTHFIVWRTPEYAKEGKSALTRNVFYSDGTTVDGQNTGSIMEGVPGSTSQYTGYHWTKSCCESCGMFNSNTSVTRYGYGKNVYILNDCTEGFIENLDDVVSYVNTDDTYHTKTVDGGAYCEFCFGTKHTHSSTLEKHTLTTTVLSQPDKQRFAVVKSCSDCGYHDTAYVAAKSVVADYYGPVDGKAHTLLVSDLSESGVKTEIRYGDSANNCTLVTPPQFH